jgi:hypothetical protein
MNLGPTTVLVSGLLLVACAPTYSLTIQTEPQGALLVEQGTGAQFRSPAVLTYALTEEHLHLPNSIGDRTGASASDPLSPTG